MMVRIGKRIDGSGTPARDRDLCFLGQLLGGDFVAQAPHDIATRPDEYDSEIATEIGKLRVLGHESPADPGTFSARRTQGALKAAIIDIAAPEMVGNWVDDMRGTDAHRFIRFTDKHTVPIRFGEKCNRSQARAIFVIEFPDGVNEAHCRFAAIHNRNPFKFAIHKPPASTRRTITKLPAGSPPAE